jgi:hypothetical protein
VRGARKPPWRPSSERRARRALVLTLVATAVLGILFWHSPLLWPLKILAVTLHELGHATAAWLVGGHVDRIALSGNEGGVTYLWTGAALWKRILVSSAGYLGSTGFGAALLVLASGRARWRPRAVFWILGGGLLVLAALLFRDAFSWAFALGTSAALLALARFAPDEIIRPGAVGLSAFICLYALWDLRADLWHLPWDPVVTGTDADALAHLTHVPALVWALCWSALAVLAVGLAVRHVLRR